MSNRALKIQSTPLEETKQLSPSVHGKGCAIGELRLTQDELQSINAIIEYSGFRFINVKEELKKPEVHVVEEVTPARPKRTARSRKAAAVAHELTPSVKRRRASSSPAPPVAPQAAAAAATTAATTEQPAAVPAAPAPVPTTAAPPTVPPAVTPVEETSVVVQTDASLYITTVTPVICSQKKKSHFLVHSPDLTWESACGKLLSILENNPQSKWFSIPVDPQVQGLQDYYEKIKTPMDLQTVRQKLEGGMYCHPFRWQHDVRTIFFNAFLYHLPDTPVWRSAAELAITFENLCKEMVEANPYCVFIRPPPAPPPPPVLSSNVVTSVTVPSAVPPSAENQLHATTEQAHPAGASTMGDVVPVTAAGAGAVSSVVSTAQSSRKITSGPTKVRKSVPPGVKIKEPGNVVTYTADCAGTELAKFYEDHLPNSALPEPKLSQGTGLDSGAQNRTGGVSNSQKKNLPARFRELDVFYRKALLNWVKDELGIHPLLCALDVRYVPDLDLLPPVKAKQFFVHMKSLMTQQKQAQDESYLPTTLPRVLSWDIPSATQASQPSPNKVSARAAIPNSVSNTPIPALNSQQHQMVTGASQLSTPHRTSWAVTNRQEVSSDEEFSEDSSSSDDDSSTDEINPAAAAAMPNTPTPPAARTWAAGSTLPWGGLGKQRPLPSLSLGLWRQSGGYNNAAAPPQAAETQPTCWGEWKARVLQHDFQLKAKAQGVAAASESEARAEGADPEI